MQVVPCIQTKRGTTANHHMTADGLIGERVTLGTADLVLIHDDHGGIVTLTVEQFRQVMEGSF